MNKTDISCVCYLRIRHIIIRLISEVMLKILLFEEPGVYVKREAMLWRKCEGLLVDGCYLI